MMGEKHFVRGRGITRICWPNLCPMIQAAETMRGRIRTSMENTLRRTGLGFVEGMLARESYNPTAKWECKSAEIPVTLRFC